MSKSFSIEVYNCPGKTMNQKELESLSNEILDIAKTCLDEIPHYQCLTGSKEEFSRLIISIARDLDGEAIGFCSSYILEVPQIGNVLHLGLTCVKPKARRFGLTHKLTSKVVTTYLFRYSLFKPAWISNVACVISSLGNVALNFEDVYPSPFKREASEEQKKIAQYISDNYRWELYINKGATFSSNKFVFKGSVTGTMFEKSESNKEFFHRDQELTQFYLDRINFKDGDEVLQIGKVSLLTYPRYLLKKMKRKPLISRELPVYN